MFAALLSTLSIPLLFSGTTIQSYVCQPPVTPVITFPTSSDTVTAGTVDFTGTATASSQVTLSIDNTDVALTTADQTNNFAVQASVAAGSHTIQVTSTSSCGSATGDIATIDVTNPPAPPPLPEPPSIPPTLITPGNSEDNTPPVTPPSTEPGTPSEGRLTLSIISPKGHSSTTAASAYVRGATSLPALVEISVNGQTVAKTLVPSTAYGLSVPLSIGDNTITVTATSSSNQQASASINVTRTQKPANPVVWTTLAQNIGVGFLILVVLLLVIWFLR